MFYACSRPAVDGVFRFLLRAEVGLASSFAVRNEQAGSLVSAVGDGRGAAAGPVDFGPAAWSTLPTAERLIVHDRAPLVDCKSWRAVVVKPAIRKNLIESRLLICLLLADVSIIEPGLVSRQPAVATEAASWLRLEGILLASVSLWCCCLLLSRPPRLRETATPPLSCAR